MGNKLCKKKGGESIPDDKPHAFDRIINRLHLKPTTWKSDPQLNEKQTNRVEVKTRKSKNGIVQHSRPLSNAKSSDWTEASLEVPDKEEVVHLKNPQLSLIFNDDSTPTPPPRKHKKTLREKLETAAKNGLQALQTKKIVSVSKEAPKEESPKPVEEPPFIKKTVIYGCPLDDHDHGHHNRDHKHPHKKDADKVGSLKFSKDAKRKKNLSVVSLPNINEFRFSLKKDDSDNNSVENPEQKPKKTASTGKIESYMHRCRSIGSIFPQKTKSHKHQNTLNDADSDDSFGGLEDWDCKILEHYKPKDASLQRPRRPLSEDAGLSDVEKLIVSQEEYERDNPPPARPVRRSESLVKKEENAAAAVVAEEPVVKRKKDNDDAQKPLLEKKTEEIIEKIVSTPAPKQENVKRSLLQRRSDENNVATSNTVVKKLTFQKTVEMKQDDSCSTTKTPPPTPVVYDNKRESVISISKLTTKDEEGNIEHSSLIKLLHEYSKKEAEEKKLTEKSEVLEEKLEKKEDLKAQSSDKNQPLNSDCKISNAVEDFLNAERKNNNVIKKPNSKSALDIFAESKCQVVS